MQRRPTPSLMNWERACASLVPRPSRFPVALNLDGDPIRKRLYRGHLLFYRILPKDVEVVRIIHAARNWAALLQGRESGT